MEAIITTRIPAEAAEAIGFFTRQEHLDRSTLVRQLLLSALEEKKIEYALQQYKEGEITIGKAAEVAGVPLRKMMRIASAQGIPFQYSVSDLEKDFKAAQ